MYENGFSHDSYTKPSRFSMGLLAAAVQVCSLKFKRLNLRERLTLSPHPGSWLFANKKDQMKKETTYCYLHCQHVSNLRKVYGWAAVSLAEIWGFLPCSLFGWVAGLLGYPAFQSMKGAGAFKRHTADTVPHTLLYRLYIKDIKGRI